MFHTDIPDETDDTPLIIGISVSVYNLIVLVIILFIYQSIKKNHQVL